MSKDDAIFVLDHAIIVLLIVLFISSILVLLAHIVWCWQQDWTDTQESQDRCNHSWPGIRVYTRRARDLFFKRVWYICPSCCYKKPEARAKHAK